MCDEMSKKTTGKYQVFYDYCKAYLNRSLGIVKSEIGFGNTQNIDNHLGGIWEGSNKNISVSCFTTSFPTRWWLKNDILPEGIKKDHVY